MVKTTFVCEWCGRRVFYDPRKKGAKYFGRNKNRSDDIVRNIRICINCFRKNHNNYNVFQVGPFGD